jgi:hypothetical protein
MLQKLRKIANMQKSIITLLFSYASLSYAVAFEAAPVTNLEKRAFYANGGWALLTTSETLCPTGTTGHDDGGITVCCPNGLESPYVTGPGARICCPPGILTTSLNER